MTYSTGSLEKPSRIGFLDSQEFSDGRPLTSNVLREMARTGNRLITKPQLVFKHVGNTAIVSASITSELDIYNNSYTNNLIMWGVAPNRWEPLIPRVIVRKPPGHRTAKVRMRMRLFPADRDFYFKILAAGQKHAQTEEGIYINSSGSAGNVIDYEVRLNDAEFEEFRFVMRCDYRPSSDPLMNTGTFGGFNQGIGSLGSVIGLPNSWIIPTGTFSTLYQETMPYAGHYARVQPQEFTSSPELHILIKQVYRPTVAVSYFRMRELVPANGNLVQFYIHKAPEYIIDSISIYTKEEDYDD